MRCGKHGATMKTSRFRALAALVVIVLTVVSFALRFGFGSYSSFGFGGLMYACPVGILESMLGVRAPDWVGLLCLAGVILGSFVVGKAFCSWICPTPWIRRIFGVKVQESEGAQDRMGCASRSCEPSDVGCRVAPCSRCGKVSLPAIGGERDGRTIDSRHGVLVGALLSSFIFGFPVFCLVCPIGLTFASILAVGYAFSQHVFIWDLIVFPVVLVFELVLFKSWCFKICPVSALLSFLSNKKRIIRPRVSRDACLRAKGIDCRVCVGVCPEKVDPHSLEISECTQCGMCVDACPARAIRLIPRNGSNANEASALLVDDTLPSD